MLVLVPVMFITTLALTLFYVMSMSYAELNTSPAISNDFMMVHEWRIAEVVENDITDGAVSAYPGYPFEPFFNYYTEVHETDAFLMIVTWPDGSNGSIDLPDISSQSILSELENRFGGGMYGGNYRPNSTTSGGRIASFDLVGMDRSPDAGSPVLLKVFIKE